MPRISIQQFRASLAGHAEPGALVRAYREIARRPELATGARVMGWSVWPPDVSAEANA
ncbi:hypothetical protein [Longimicrobium sp.]|uniref:hypothetical protein n=1 Tax=Longimicrobium sp. TaxID=2029185 RepID=UPI002C7B12A9|nr:hypothetical protein [Longimicrobium sp.]HSU12611.1 hypothetical protein [Longimicrobium sp.]